MPKRFGVFLRRSDPPADELPVELPAEGVERGVASRGVAPPGVAMRWWEADPARERPEAAAFASALFLTSDSYSRISSYTEGEGTLERDRNTGCTRSNVVWSGAEWCGVEWSGVG